MVNYVLRDVGLTFTGLANGETQRIPGKRPYRIGSALRQGLRTPTGKYELYSETSEKFKYSHGLEPLPVYRDSADNASPAEFPLILVAGGRLPQQFHSRLHNVKMTKFLRPNPALDINPVDAKRLGIKQDDQISVTTSTGVIHVWANVTHLSREGAVFMYQGYENADVNRIIALDHLDPYSGFPGYRSVRCAVAKESRV
jgi:anaerobic selenocysteine-containing dehydrogenase